MSDEVVLTDEPPVYVRPAGLGSLGSGSYFAKPFTIRTPHRVHIGADVRFEPRAFFSVHEEYAGEKFEPTLRIGDRCVFDSDLMISCIGTVEIGADVWVSRRVYIGDHAREYGDLSQVPSEWPISEPEPVSIGDNVYIGIGAIVMPGTSIGAGAMISAGSVVTRSVPPRSIVFGNPARVVKSWDEEKGDWRIGAG